jgi:RNA polymerase sigma factor for flagellar operon FliA
VILDHLPLVRSIAIRVHSNLPVHVDLEDLEHAGVLGLIDAVTKFDTEKSVPFSSYAKHRIKGAILDSLRDLDWASRDLRKRQKQAEQAIRELTAELKRAPAEEEVAARLGLDVKRWRDFLNQIHSSTPVSASSRGAEQEDLPAPDFPADRATQPDYLCVQAELREMLSRAIQSLPERYRKVVLLYYQRDMTMKEIGGLLGINESRVSQIHKLALDKMAVALHASGVDSAGALRS